MNARTRRAKAVLLLLLAVITAGALVVLFWRTEGLTPVLVMVAAIVIGAMARHRPLIERLPRYYISTDPRPSSKKEPDKER